MLSETNENKTFFLLTRLTTTNDPARRRIQYTKNFISANSSATGGPSRSHFLVSPWLSLCCAVCLLHNWNQFQAINYTRSYRFLLSLRRALAGRVRCRDGNLRGGGGNSDERYKLSFCSLKLVCSPPHSEKPASQRLLLMTRLDLLYTLSGGEANRSFSQAFKLSR